MSESLFGVSKHARKYPKINFAMSLSSDAKGLRILKLASTYVDILHTFFENPGIGPS